MKTRTNTKQTRGFTLIEMIGVLAVIAILAALLIPKVFQAITEAKINTVPVGASTCKTAAIDHYAKFGALYAGAATNDTTMPVANYDETVLLAEGFLDKPFAPKVGTSADVLLDVVSTAAATAGNEGQTYWLSGIGSNTNEVHGSHVVYATILDVPAADAQAISARIDGLTMSSTEAAPGTEDLKGRVKYGTITTTGPVYIYLTHR